ncbi:DMT family transporter [Pseudomonas chlororaphis]|uniref:DMT family transporter n=1 Tax=Pseudomonas chlororaphis TaxID=587753 RepID=UPI0023668AA0|nr:DMT family transporter [Pseudomonas chlororaphis]WDH24352.1 DMT family transporter [Pseudomonas chlororaphis]
MKPTSLLNAHLGMLLWAVLIAASFFAAARVSQAVDPLLLTGLRLLLSALMFVPALWLNGTFRINRAGLRAHAMLGLLLAIYFASLFEALRHTSAVNTGILFALVPLLTLLFESVLLRGDPAKNRLLSMLLAAAGAMLLTFRGSGPEGMPSLYAVGVYGVGCLAMAGYSPLSQRLKATSLKDRSPAAMTFWNMLFGALFLFAFCLPGGGWRSAMLLTLDDGLWLLYLALFATLATFWLLHRAIGVIAPATVISYIYLSTLFITLFHWFGLGRHPLPGELLGALLVGLGMLAPILGSRRPVPVPG